MTVTQKDLMPDRPVISFVKPVLRAESRKNKYKNCHVKIVSINYRLASVLLPPGKQSDSGKRDKNLLIVMLLQVSDICIRAA